MDIGEEEEVIEVEPGIAIPAEWPTEAPAEPEPIVEPDHEPVGA